VRWRVATAMFGLACVSMICPQPASPSPELIAVLVWDLLRTRTLVRLL